jgi:hypothetical protein
LQWEALKGRRRNIIVTAFCVALAGLYFCSARSQGLRPGLSCVAPAGAIDKETSGMRNITVFMNRSHEVDFVLEDGPEPIPIEANLTSNPTGRDAASIVEFQRLFGRKAGKGLVVCLCRERFPLTREIDAVPLGSF